MTQMKNTDKFNLSVLICLFICGQFGSPLRWRDRRPRRKPMAYQYKWTDQPMCIYLGTVACRILVN